MHNGKKPHETLATQKSTDSWRQVLTFSLKVEFRDFRQFEQMRGKARLQRTIAVNWD